MGKKWIRIISRATLCLGLCGIYDVCLYDTGFIYKYVLGYEQQKQQTTKTTTITTKTTTITT